MRWVYVLGVSISITLLASFALALPATADGGGSGSCDVRFDPTCTVGVDTGGDDGDHDHGGNNGSSEDPCASYPDAAYGDVPPKVSQACADELHANFCKATLGDIADGLELSSLDNLTVQQVELVNRDLVDSGCQPLVTPATLAGQAFRTITFPKPSGDRSPSSSHIFDGYPFTYVDLPTFFWTSADTWTARSATASLDGLSATVTARPTELVYDPGDGGQPTVCRGPGRPWTIADGNGPPTGGACAYTYRKVTSAPITSTQTIVWQITWVGTGGTGGEIPSLSTSTTGQLQVLQVQVVNR